MRVTVTGATGLIGTRLVAALARRGDEVTVLSRDPGARPRAARLGHRGRRAGTRSASRRRPRRSPAATAWSTSPASRSRSAGAPTRRSASARAARAGTRNLVAGLRSAEPRPRVLVSASAVGYYGAARRRAGRRVRPAGRRLPRRGLRGVGARGAGGRRARACASRSCAPASCSTRTAARSRRCCRRSRLGVGGPVAGGRQYMPWIHVDDLVGLYLAALDGEAWSGPLNGSAPEPATNRDFSKALGRALHRPAVAPVPRLALRALYGEMDADRHDRAARRARRGRSRSATRSRTPSSTRRCAQRSAEAPLQPAGEAQLAVDDAVRAPAVAATCRPRRRSRRARARRRAARCRSTRARPPVA